MLVFYGDYCAIYSTINQGNGVGGREGRHGGVYQAAMMTIEGGGVEAEGDTVAAVAPGRRGGRR